MNTPEDPSEPFQFNRMEALKNVLFDFFADHETSPSKLYYKEVVSFISIFYGVVVSLQLRVFLKFGDNKSY